MRAYARLEQLSRLDDRNKYDYQFEVLRKENDWLYDYRGYTYSGKLKDALTRGLFEEHAKKSDIGYANIEKAMVFCIDPKTMVIDDLNGSCLLREKKSEKVFESVLQSVVFKHRRVIPDLILDNFGTWFSRIMSTVAVSNTAVLTDDANSSQTFNILSSSVFFNANNAGHQIKMGSGSTAPARSDHAIQTSLGASPESGYLAINEGSYTVSNTIIYQGDANPTGGSGTVNEIGSFGHWQNTATVMKDVMVAHDAVGGVAYSAGKLLRGAYTWQI